MSTKHWTSDGRADAEATDSEADTSETRIESLEAELDVLRAENDRLRADYARARRESHRRTALALAGVGVLAVLGGVVLPDVRSVLFVTGAIGLFGGILTWYLTPERVVPVGVSESIYEATAATLTGIRNELGLQSVTVYVPVGEDVRGFIPRHREFELPESVASVFVTEDAARGVSFCPSGRRLATEFEKARTTHSPEDPPDTVTQLGDALVEQFEIADGVAVQADTGQSRIFVSLRGVAFGPLTRIDHPAASMLACGLADELDSAVLVEHVDDTTIALQLDPAADEWDGIRE